MLEIIFFSLVAVTFAQPTDFSNPLVGLIAETNNTPGYSFDVTGIDQTFYIKQCDDLVDSQTSIGDGTFNNPFVGFFEGLNAVESVLQNSSGETVAIYLLDQYYHVYIPSNSSVVFSNLNDKNLTIFLLPYYLSRFMLPGTSDKIIQNCLDFIRTNQSAKPRISLFLENFQINAPNVTLVLINLEFHGGDLIMDYDFTHPIPIRIRAIKPPSYFSLIAGCYKNFAGCCGNSSGNLTIIGFCYFVNNQELKRDLTKRSNFTLFKVGQGIADDVTFSSNLMIVSCKFSNITSMNSSSSVLSSLISVSLGIYNNVIVSIIACDFVNLYFPDGILKTELVLPYYQAVGGTYTVYMYDSNVIDYNSHNFSEAAAESQYDPYWSPVQFKVSIGNFWVSNIDVSNSNNFILINSGNLSILDSRFYLPTIRKSFIILDSDAYFTFERCYFNGTINNIIFPDSNLIEAKYNNNFLTLTDLMFVSMTLENWLLSSTFNSINMTNIIFSKMKISCIIDSENRNTFLMNRMFLYQLDQFIKVVLDIPSVFSFSHTNKINITNLTVSNSSLGENVLIYFKSFNLIGLDSVAFLDLIFDKNSSTVLLNNDNQINISSIIIVNSSSISLTANNSITISNSIFIFMSSAADYEGSTFTFNKNNTVSVVYCSFHEIHSYTYTGIIYASYLNKILINNSNFTDSSSHYYSSLIYLVSDNSINATNCNLTNLASRLDGGLIYAFYGNTIGLSFLNLSDISTSSGCGGLIYMEESNQFELSYANLLWFSAASSGGVLFSARDNYVLILNSVINQSEALFGGVFYLSITTNFSIFSSEIQNCFSNRSGAVFFAQNSTNITIDQCLFSSTYANLAGGILYLDQSNQIFITNSAISNSSSNNQAGGALYFGDSNTIFASNNTFYSISSSVDAGCIYLVTNNNMQYQNNSIRSASSVWEGGAISFGDSNSATIIASSFNDISSDNKGGIIFFEDLNSVEIRSCHFENSTGAEGGGVFYLRDENIVIFTLNRIQNCKSSHDSIILYARYSNQILFNASVITNISSADEKEASNFNYYMSYESDLSNTKSDVLQSKSQFFLSRDNSMTLQNSIFQKIIGETFIMSQESQVSIFSCIFEEISTSFNIIVNFFLGFEKILEMRNVTFSKIDSPNCLFIGGASVILKSISFLTFQTTSVLFLKIFDSRKCLISNSRFVNKNQISGSDVSSHMAGFLEAKDSFLDITKSAFINGRGKQGGAIHTESSILKVRNSFFFVNRALSFGGAIHCNVSTLVNNSGLNSVSLKLGGYILISNTIAISNSADNGGGFISLFNSENFSNSNTTPKTIQNERIQETLGSKAVIFKRNTFIYNKALLEGGSFYLYNLGNNWIFKNKIVGNMVGIDREHQDHQGKGGAIGILTDLGEQNNFFLRNLSINFTIIDSTFRKNQAFIGGVIFWKGAPVSLKTLNSTFASNLAIAYGHFVASNIHSFRIISSQTFNDVTIKQNNASVELQLNGLVSGNSYDQCLAFITPLDYYSQTAINTEETFPDIFNSNQNLFYENQTSFYCIKGLFVRKKSELSEKFNIQFDQTKLFNSKTLDFWLNYRQCKMGERLTDDLKCVECPSMFYSFVQNFHDTTELCKSCVDENFNCYGGNRLTPKPGYWRLSNESDNFIKCPFPDSCLADGSALCDNISSSFLCNKSAYNPDLSTGYCLEGYQGNLCAECSSGYGRDVYNQLKCSKCATGLSVFLLILVMILKTGFIIWSINEAIQMCITISSDDPDINKVITNNLLKIFFNHFQTLNLIFEMPVKWPFEMGSLQAVPLFVTSSVGNGLSFQCILREWFPRSLENYPTHYFKLLLNWVYPFFLVLVCMGYLKIYSHYSRNEYIKKLTNVSYLNYFKKLLQPLYFVILMIYYCEGIQIVLQTFSCVNIGYQGNPHNVMRQELGVQCWGDSHYTYSYKVALPFLIIFGICFPLYIFLLLLRKFKKGSLDRKTMLFKFGYFYYGLEPHFFFWDLVILMRKTLLLALGIFYLSNLEAPKNYMLLIGFMILALALYMQIYFKPYRRDKINVINHLELKSLIALVGSIFIGIFCLEMEGEGSKATNLGLLFGMILLNLYFLLFWIKAFIIYNLKFIYFALVVFLKKHLGKYYDKFKQLSDKNPLIPSEILENFNGGSPDSTRRRVRTRAKTRIGNYLMDKTEKAKPHLLQRNSLSIPNSLEMCSFPPGFIVDSKEENIFEFPTRVNEDNNSSSGDLRMLDGGIPRLASSENNKSAGKRRGGKTLDSSEKKYVKRRLLFELSEFDDIQIEQFKRDTFSIETEAFLLEKNDHSLPAKAKVMLKGISIVIKTLPPEEELINMLVTVKNDNPIATGGIQISFQSPSELYFSVMPLEILEGIRPYSDAQFKVSIKFNSFPYTLVTCRLALTLPLGVRICRFPLPHTINKFIEFLSLPLKIFRKSWKVLSGKAAVLGPFDNDKLIFSDKEELNRLFQMKLIEYDIPYYRREGKNKKEKFGCYFCFLQSKNKYLLKIKRGEKTTELEFVSINIDSLEQNPWQDFYLYEIMTYMLIKD